MWRALIPAALIAAAWALTEVSIRATDRVRDIRTRRWDRKADLRDLDNLREQVRLQCEWDAAHDPSPADWYSDRDWALIQGAIYGADFQRWEREWSA